MANQRPLVLLPSGNIGRLPASDPLDVNAYQFPGAIGSPGQALAVPASGTQLTWANPIQWQSTATIHINPAGDDLTGDGTSGNPFFTIQRALEFISDRLVIPGDTVTIQAAAGTYDYTQPQTLTHSSGAQVRIVGEMVHLDTTATGITNVTGNSGNYEVTLEFADTSNVSVGDWYYIPFCSEVDRHSNKLLGLHEVIAVPDGTHVTLAVKSLTDAPTLGTASVASVFLKSIFSWANCGDRFKLHIPQGKTVWIDYAVLHGSAGTRGSTFGYLEVQPMATLYSTGALGIANWEVGLWCKINSTIALQQAGLSGNLYGIQAVGSKIDTFHSMFNGNSLGIQASVSDISALESGFMGQDGTAAQLVQSRIAAGGSRWQGNVAGIHLDMHSSAHATISWFCDNGIGVQATDLSVARVSAAYFLGNGTDSNPAFNTTGSNLSFVGAA